MDSGIWSLFIFIIAIMALFVVVCIFCIFGCDFCSDEYEQAQHGKTRTEKTRTRSGDLETGRRFKSPEELGLMSRGRVIGVGKSD